MRRGRLRSPLPLSDELTLTTMWLKGVVEYHCKVFGGNPAGRHFASCGIQSLYKSFRAAVSGASQLTDWDIRNCHPTLLLQLFEHLNIS